MTQEELFEKIDKENRWLTFHTDRASSDIDIAFSAIKKYVSDFMQEYNKSTEPCSDAISRQAAVNAVCDSECRINPRDCGLYPRRCFTVWGLEKLPSVIPSRPTEPTEDAISRQAAIRIAKEECENGSYNDIPWKLEGLPSVNPQNCDTCEVGNPCMYCKHEFEPQESEEQE